MRVVLFGTGSGLRDLLSILPGTVTVVGLCDNDVAKQGKTLLGYSVYAPLDLAALAFDYVVVTARTGEAIRGQLEGLGIERTRVMLFYSNFDEQLRADANREMEALNRNLGLGLHPLALCTMQLWPEKKVDGVTSEDDFCRMMAMRLAADRINRREIPGAIAELGVFRGEMAAVLSRLFPARKLYLFDTFEGFSQNDLADGKEAGHSQAAVGEFKDTNVDLVLAKLAEPRRVTVRKGYFPDTAEGLEEQFALVSLDVDLYKPTLSGLQYFYPRLAAGGCIFIHDYNNVRFKGVQTAVDEFAEASGAPLVQLPDLAGTVIVSR